MASVCDPLTGQCHCKVSRGLVQTTVLGPLHVPLSSVAFPGRWGFLEAFGDKA